MDTNIENQLFQLCQNMSLKLDSIQGDFREFKGIMSTKVETLEETQKRENLWSNIKTICVIPVIACLHQIAYYLNWIR